MSSYNSGGSRMPTVRRVLREARTLSLQGDLISPRASLDAGTSGFNSRRHTYDLESPLLEQPTAEAHEAEELRAAARAAEAELFNSGSGEAAGDGRDGDRRPSLSSPMYSEHRDSRSLWRLARRNLGLSQHEESGGPAYVVRSSEGAMQPSPSAQRMEQLASGEQGAKNIADTFVEMLTGSGLGTGMALRTPSGLLRTSSAPGTFAPRTDARAVWHMLTSSFLNILLICMPIGIWAGATGASPNLVFSTNFLALIPLALFLGEVTEDLAVRFGDTIGGLLNATFGNVVELILSIAALQRGLYTVVATSLIGSILSNLLLVLGMCFFFGGLKYKEQRFSTLANKVSSSLLFLACIAIMIPSTAKVVYGPAIITQDTLFHLSHAIAIILVGIYLGYLLFQLKTHADCFEGEESTETPALSLSGAVTCLLSITAIVAVCSEYLTGAIEAVSETSGINQAFLGLIVLPIAGNAAEHITAVFVAVKNKMDLSIAVALGSSIQIAVFLIPVVVLVGWAMDKPFTLDFDSFAVLMLTVSVILAYFVSSDGTSNWLLGLQLVATYCLIGFVFLLEREPQPEPKGHSTLLRAAGGGQ